MFCRVLQHSLTAAIVISLMLPSASFIKITFKIEIVEICQQLTKGTVLTKLVNNSDLNGVKGGGGRSGTGWEVPRMLLLGFT